MRSPTRSVAVLRGHYDFAADVFSLGVVFIELLEARLPLYDTQSESVIIPRDLRVWCEEEWW